MVNWHGVKHQVKAANRRENRRLRSELKRAAALDPEAGAPRLGPKARATDLPPVYLGGHVVARTTFMQQKTHRPVQFEITEQTRQSVSAWISARGLKPADYLFPSRLHASAHVSTRRYARIVHRWVALIGLDDSAYGTHTMRRTKASLIYRRTSNLRVVQLLLGHTKIESTVLYLGIEVDDALEMAEQTVVC
ncbi:tyrosine-type recombinase/integrase [Caballeronia insecticola]